MHSMLHITVTVTQLAGICPVNWYTTVWRFLVIPSSMYKVPHLATHKIPRHYDKLWV